MMYESDRIASLREERDSLLQIVAAIVLRQGGEIFVDEVDFRAAKTAILESWKDEKNRRYAFTATTGRRTVP